MRALFISMMLANAYGVGLRIRGDDLNAYDDEPEEATFVYKPSNSNTRTPKTFADEVIPDDAYKELVPALQVLEELTTTVAPAAFR